MKSYTDIEQSRKLAEILPIESADLYYHPYPKYWYNVPNFGEADLKFNQLPAWSLTALLDILPFPQLSKDKLGSGKIGWMVSAYPDNCRSDSHWHDNPIDACYEMIVKSHEQKLL